MFIDPDGRRPDRPMNDEARDVLINGIKNLFSNIGKAISQLDDLVFGTPGDYKETIVDDGVNMQWYDSEHSGERNVISWDNIDFDKTFGTAQETNKPAGSTGSTGARSNDATSNNYSPTVEPDFDAGQYNTYDPKTGRSGTVNAQSREDSIRLREFMDSHGQIWWKVGTEKPSIVP